MWTADTSVSSPPGGFTSGVIDNGGRGWVGQVVAGYDYQFSVASLNLVAGVFGDYDFGNIKGKFDSNTAIGVGPGTIVGSESEKSYWAVGARIGLLATPQLLTSAIRRPGSTE
jgi:hypothetical protein